MVNFWLYFTPIFSLMMMFSVNRRAKLTQDRRPILTHPSAYFLFVQITRLYSPAFVAGFDDLSAQQKKLLKAIAISPVKTLLSQDFIQSYGFNSVGGIQQAQKKLGAEGLIEKINGAWTLTDPIMAAWLRQQDTIQLLDISQAFPTSGPGF